MNADGLGLATIERKQQVTQLPLRDQVRALESLQELDFKIEQIKKSRVALPSKLKTIEEGFQRAKLAVDTKRNQLVELEKIERQAKAGMELNQERLNRASTKLEAVHNSNEYNAANKEIDQLKKMNSNLEAQLAKCVADLETERKALTDLEAALELKSSEREAQIQAGNDENSKLNRDIETLISQRVPFTEKVEKRILAQYDRIRAGRGGVGIVPTVSGRCSGCNMMVPPQLYNQIQRGAELHQCPSCNRLLFIPTSGTDTTATV